MNKHTEKNHLSSHGLSKTKWYISVQNKAKGPYTDLQIREKIQAGELEPTTLSYKEGEPDWLPLEKQDIWSPGFVPSHPLEAQDSKNWVLLVESPIKKGEYEQQGPFSKKEVHEKVNSGEVHLKDFCWRAGMEKWKPLVEIHELSFPRKEPISFQKIPDGEVHNSADFFEERESFEELLKPLPNLSSQMPDFVSPEDLVQTQNEEKDLIDLKNDLKNPLLQNSVVSDSTSKSTRKLTPLGKKVRNKKGHQREILSYLILVLFAFTGAFYLGLKNSTGILKGVEFLGESMVSVTKEILPQPPKVSYVFLRELPLTKGTILIKTDAQPGTEIFVRLVDENTNLIKTKTGAKMLTLSANKNGEAFLELSKFRVINGKSYSVSTQVGHLIAKENYRYSVKSFKKATGQ